MCFLLASSRGSGKHPQLVPSTPRWAVANGAGVILSVCDDEVARNETAILTAAAVPALLLPPPTTALDEHLVAGLPALEPYARLFHRLFRTQCFLCYLVVHREICLSKCIHITFADIMPLLLQVLHKDFFLDF